MSFSGCFYSTKKIVYCKNCKLFKKRRVEIKNPDRNSVEVFINDKCCIEQIMEFVDTWYKRKLIVKEGDYINPWIRNKNNDCPNYEKKWWKVFLKEEEILVKAEDGILELNETLEEK